MANGCVLDYDPLGRLRPEHRFSNLVMFVMFILAAIIAVGFIRLLFSDIDDKIFELQDEHLSEHVENVF